MAMSGTVASEWPLVGREAELERVGRLLDQGGPGVVLAGAPGVGKTRLAAECLLQAGERGCVPVRAVATRAGAGLPFGAFAALLPELAPGADRTEILRQVARSIETQGQGRRVALLVDDAHLLDEASAALTLQLAASNKAFVIATVRSGEPAPDAVVALWKDSLLQRLELARLGLAQTEALLAAVLGAPPDGATATMLWERAQGNILFLRELVLAASEAGIVSDAGGVWRIRGPLCASARLVEIVELRLVGLPEEDRRALELLALSEPLGVDLIQHLGTSLEALERRGLARILESDRRLEARLAHPLYGDVVRARLSPLRTRALSSSLAEATETAGGRRADDALRVATWRLDGGGSVRAELMLTAARQARTRWALPLAKRLAQAAVEAEAGFDARLLLGQLHWLQSRSQEAEDELASLTSSATDDSQRAMLAASRMDILCFGLARLDEAMRVAEEAEAAIADQVSRDGVAAQRARLGLVFGDARGAIEVAAPVVSRAEGPTLVDACMTAAAAFALNGRTGEAVDVTERGLSAHQALGPVLPLGSYIHLVIRCVALTWAGRLQEAEALARDQYAQAARQGALEAQGLFAIYLARTLLHEGAGTTASRFAREGLGLLRERGSAYFLREALTHSAHADALLGDSDRARRTLAELDRLRLPATMLFGVEVLQARAWTEVAAGDIPAAHRFLHEAAAMAEAGGQRVLRGAVLHDLARLGKAAEVAGPLQELADEVEGPLAPARAAHAAALAAGDPRALEAASHAFEEIGAILFAAEARAGVAAEWQRAGELRKAAAATRQAALLAARCNGVRTPALAAATVRARLSPRELEIARLAASGIANKKIAARLCFSVRTVENRLHAAYEKLGVCGREELAHALEGP